MVTTHVRAAPVQAPLQPASLEPAAAVAVSVTRDPVWTTAQQRLPQLIPPALLETVPSPEVATASGCPDAPLKSAVTARAAPIVTLQVVPPPAHAPPHPTKPAPGLGVATSATELPLAKDAVQDDPHEIPAGAEATAPLPAAATVSRNAGGVKVASTFLGPSITTAQGTIPEQAPPQPANVQPGAGAAVSVTVLPVAKPAAQAVPQSIPAGALVTLPLPVVATAIG
jgi:hypothetical protein